MDHLLSQRFRRHALRARLFPRPGTAIVAVSGGADSVALLDLLHALAADLGLTLVVAHADHGIQSDSRTVGQSVAALATTYGLPFELGELRLGSDATETTARRARYAGPAERRAWDAALELMPELALHVEHRGFSVAREALRRYDATVAVALVRAAARRAGLVLGPARARRLLTLAAGPSGRRQSLGGGWVAEAAFHRLRMTRGTAAAPEQVVATADQGGAHFGTFQVAWRVEPAPARVGRGGWSTWLPATGGGWELRPPRSGDRLIPVGGVGRRPLRRLLMEAHVPRGERAAYPVVARGETVLWVPGIARAAAEIPAPGTRAVRLDVVRDGEPENGRDDAQADRL